MQSNRFSGLVAVLGLVSIIIGLIIMIMVPAIRLASLGLLLLGILLLGTAFVMDIRRVGRALTGRRGMFGTGTTVMISIVVGIVLFANAISIGNFKRFDTTGLAQFTLTSQTKDVLAKLDKPVKITCFFTPADSYGVDSYATALLNEYKNLTDKLTIETIDPDEHPDQARKYGITDYSTIIFESQTKRRAVLASEIAEKAENAFTSSILEVTGIVQKKVYFLTGHGEASVDGELAAARDELRNNLYEVWTLDLLRTPVIPQDTAALIIAAPRSAMDPSEINIVRTYLASGGWVIIMVNPGYPQDVAGLVSDWGVDIVDGTVIDPASYSAPNKDNPSVPRTRNLFGLSVVYFPGATAVVPKDGLPENIQVQPIVWTSTDSWLEKNFESNKESVFDEGTDTKGPYALGALIAASPVDQSGNVDTSIMTRIIVFGDSDFASTQHFYNGDNGNLFLNSVNLLSSGKELISIQRKVLPFRRLVVGPESTLVINYTSVGLLPILVLIIGGIMWWRRK